MQNLLTTPESLLDLGSTGLRETEVSIISEGSSFEGTLELQSVVRMLGSLQGVLRGKPGSLIVLAESAHIEGRIEADTLWVEGFVRGDIVCRTKIVLAKTARVIGNIQGPAIEIQHGAFLDGTCKIDRKGL